LQIANDLLPGTLNPAGEYGEQPLEDYDLISGMQARRHRVAQYARRVQEVRNHGDRVFQYYALLMSVMA
jgi:hypothetical protein